MRHCIIPSMMKVWNLRWLSSCVAILAVHAFASSAPQTRVTFRLGDYTGAPTSIDSIYSESVAVPANGLVVNSSAPPTTINIGSTYEEVESVLGPRDSIMTRDTTLGSTWFYGTSSLTFDSSGRLREYSKGSSPLKIKLTYTISGPRPTVVRIGSSKDEVLAVFGEPTSMYDNLWFYGTSHISFDQNRKVHGYQIGNTSFVVYAALLPSASSVGNNHNGAQSRSSSYVPSVAENGSYYGELSEATGAPKTVHVGGYYRSDGAYVRGHYRSNPR